MATDIQSVVWKFYNNAIARTTYADTPSAVYEYLGRLGFTKPGVTNRWKDAAASINYQYRGDIDMQNKVALGTISVAPINALFVNNEQGLWYDPSQFDTMFQDSAGTTPVTAAGDPAGLILDKRLWGGRTLAQVVAGQPELITNGSFVTNDLTGWTNNSTGTGTASGATGAAVLIGTDGSNRGQIAQGFTTVVGRWYRFAWNNALTSGSITISKSDAAASQSNAVAVFSTGTQLFFVATATTTYFRAVTNTGGGNGSIDNISVKEIPGNHASQATSAARPVLARVPFGGRRNLLIRTEDYSTGWTLTNASGGASRNGNVLTFGSNALDRFVQSNVTLAAAQHTGSIVLSGTGAVRLYLIGGDGTAGTPTNVTLTSTPTRYSVTRTPAGSGSVGGIGIYNNAGGSPSTVTIDQAQLETGAAFTAYQKVTSTHDVTEAGKADCWHLSFDGSDDFLVTGNVDFTGGDEIVAVGGIRKIAAATSIIAELSVSADANTASFQLATLSSGDYFKCSVRGSGTLQSAIYSAGLAVTRVMSGLGSISSDTTKLRLNGIEVNSNSNDLGSGPFGNYPIYIGRRGGSSLPFAGHLYGLVVRAGLPDAGQLAAVEQYMAGKTGVSF